MKDWQPKLERGYITQKNLHLFSFLSSFTANVFLHGKYHVPKQKTIEFLYLTPFGYFLYENANKNRPQMKISD